LSTVQQSTYQVSIKAIQAVSCVLIIIRPRFLGSNKIHYLVFALTWRLNCTEQQIALYCPWHGQEIVFQKRCQLNTEQYCTAIGNISNTNSNTSFNVYRTQHQKLQLVSSSLTSPFSTNMAISETKGQRWRAISTQWRKTSDILTSTLAAFLFISHPKGKGIERLI